MRRGVHPYGAGLGPPDQSMWTDDELRGYAEAEATYFREHDVRVAVTGWTLTALLSTRLAGIPLVTEHAGSWVPPVFERGLLPLPSTISIPYERWMPNRMRRRLVNPGVARLTLYTAGFNRVAGRLGVEDVPSLAALLLGELTLVTDVPEVLGIPVDELESWTPRDPSRLPRRHAAALRRPDLRAPADPRARAGRRLPRGRRHGRLRRADLDDAGARAPGRVGAAAARRAAARRRHRPRPPRPGGRRCSSRASCRATRSCRASTSR